MTHLRPHFFIIGERKCGTSSLYRYLVAHPHVLPGSLKEPNFFGQHDEATLEAQIGDYLALFPLEGGGDAPELTWPELDERGVLYEERVEFQRVPGRSYVTGEASANTFYDVEPALLRRFLPEARLILLLRDPVERAYSHHRMYARFQEEGRDLGFSVGDFESDVRAEIAALAEGGPAPSVGPGVYAPRLERWLKVWGHDRLRVHLTEELDEPDRCRAILDDLQRYLELPRHAYGDIVSQKFNRAPQDSMPPAARRLLAEFYAPHNAALERLLGRTLPWT
jgi:hypothetical protein